MERPRQRRDIVGHQTFVRLNGHLGRAGFGDDLAHDPVA